MTNTELQKMVEELSLTYFHKPFMHTAVFNSRLRSTGGRYHLADHHLDINPKMVACGEETLKGIILHELCHYHLHLNHLPHQHRDPAFKKLLAQVGGLRYAPTLAENENRAPRKKLTYECCMCHQLYLRQKKINTRKYVCGKCHGKLMLIAS